MLLQEVVRCMPGEWGQCVPIVEWIRYNTPSRCGITPRDLDKGWSIVSPLERELLPFEPARAETVSETARTQFDAFRKVRTVSLQYKMKEGRRRAELANRVRTARLPAEGDLVMLRNPARTKTRVGHRPGKFPVEGPFEVRAATGTSVDITDVSTGAKRSGVHAEN